MGHFSADCALIASAFNVMVLTGGWIYFAMARDGVFFPRAARFHPRFQVPGQASVLASSLDFDVHFSGTFAQLLTYTTVVIVGFSAVTVPWPYLFYVGKTNSSASVSGLGVSVAACTFTLSPPSVSCSMRCGNNRSNVFWLVALCWSACQCTGGGGEAEQCWERDCPNRLLLLQCHHFLGQPARYLGSGA